MGLREFEADEIERQVPDARREGGRGDRADLEMLAACEEAGIAFAPFFPLGGGRELDDDRLAKVAARHRASVAQIGLAWLLSSSPVTLAIPGTGSVRHLEENMATESVVLSDEDLADLA